MSELTHKEISGLLRTVLGIYQNMPENLMEVLTAAADQLEASPWVSADTSPVVPEGQHAVAVIVAYQDEMDDSGDGGFYTAEAMYNGNRYEQIEYSQDGEWEWQKTYFPVTHWQYMPTHPSIPLLPEDTDNDAG